MRDNVAAQLLRRSQQVGCLQVLSNDSVQDDAKHNLDVGGVCCRGEVGIDDLLLVEVALHELTLNEPTGSLHITIWTCTTQGERGEKVGEVVRGISQKQENDIREGLEEKHEKKWHGNTVASGIQPYAVTQDYPTPPSTSLLKDTHIHRCLYTSHSTNTERVGRGWCISYIIETCVLGEVEPQVAIRVHDLVPE